MGVSATVVTIIGMILSLGTTIQQTGAALQQGEETKKYNEELARQFEEQGTATGTQAHLDTVWHRQNVKRFTASQEAALAASGNAGTQTALELMSDTARQAALDELAIRRNADIRVKESFYHAKMARQAGRNAMYAAQYQAGSSLISGAGMVADSWYKWSQTSQGNTNASGLGRRPYK
jgi:hypothetical protein